MTANILMTRKHLTANKRELRYTFPSPVQFSRDQEVALVGGTLYNSFINVSADKGNNSLKFVVPWYGLTSGYALKTYVVPLADGYYSLDDLNNVLIAYCIANGLYIKDTNTGEYVVFLTIQANAVLYKCQINAYRTPSEAELPVGWTHTGQTFIEEGVPVARMLVNPYSNEKYYWLFKLEGIAAMMGFTPAYYPTDEWDPATAALAWNRTPFTAVGTMVPDINPVSSVVVACNLVQSSYSSPSTLVGQIPITARFGALVQYAVPYPTFAAVLPGGYSEVVLGLYDQLGNSIALLDPDVTMTLQIRNKK